MLIFKLRVVAARSRNSTTHKELRLSSMLIPRSSILIPRSIITCGECGVCVFHACGARIKAIRICVDPTFREAWQSSIRRSKKYGTGGADDFRISRSTH